jgi:predicted RNA-binding Zn-ribbon protein involved in translation (DUF1610 family)
MSTSTLERRVKALEASAGGVGGGCPRCAGTLVIVGDAMTRKFHSASWNGEPLSEEEVSEHKMETECPRCGRKLDPENTLEIKVGGRRRSRAGPGRDSYAGG